MCIKARPEIQYVDVCMYVCMYVHMSRRTRRATLGIHTVCRDLGDFFPLPETWSFTVGGRCLFFFVFFCCV